MKNVDCSLDLSILIPTYNRARDLDKNLKLLNSYIDNNKLSGRVNIIVSNNKSTDETIDVIARHEKSNHVVAYNQPCNIGLEKNALYVLEKSESKFVMYLGDDDYLDEQYLMQVLDVIGEYAGLSCVIPSFVGITPSGDIIPNNGRDIGLKSKFFHSGYTGCYINAARGHQLSGLVFRRDGLFDAYRDNNVCNIYPFIFFVAYSCLHGDVFHLTDYPVKVTQPGQDKKDWGYKDDGLISEIFDNYAKLPDISAFQRFLLEMKLLADQPWRITMYGRQMHLAVLSVIKNKNSSILTKIFITPFMTLKVSEFLLRHIYKLIKS